MESVEKTVPRKESYLVFGVVSLVVLVAVGTVSGFFTSYDYLRMHQFNLAYLAESLRHFELPLWNPYVGLGLPFAANPEAAVFYPGTWPVALLGPSLFAALSLAFHFGFAGVSFLHLARYLGVNRLGSWLGMFSFLASAQMFNRLSAGHLGVLNTACYIPLIVLLAVRWQEERSRRRFGLLALAVGLQILCGHPQVVWMTVLSTFFFLTGRRLQRPLAISIVEWLKDACGFGASVLLGALVSAVILLPLLEYTGQSLRSLNDPKVVHVMHMLKWSLASFFYSPWSLMGRNPEQAYYLGIFPLLAGAIGLTQIRDRNVRGLWLVMVGCLILGLTDQTPLFDLAKAIIPGYTMFRIHARFAILIGFALSLAMALAVSRKFSVIALMGATVVMLALGCWLVSDSLPVMQSVNVDSHDWARMIGLMLLVPVWLFAWQSEKTLVNHQRLWLMVVAGLLLSGDLAFVYSKARAEANKHLTVFPLEKEIKSYATVKQEKSRGIPTRIMVGPALVRNNFGLEAGFSSPSFFVQLPLLRVWYYLHSSLNLPLSTELSAFPNLAIYQQGPFPYATMNLELGYDAKLGLMENHQPDPRAYKVDTVTVNTNWEACIRFQRESTNPESTTFVEHPLALAWANKNQIAPAEIVEFQPEKIKVRLPDTSAGLLVLSESFYPGWQARVGGQTVDCVPVNIWMRGVPLAGGAEEVEVFYNPKVYWRGAGLSLFGLLVIGVLLRKPKQNVLQI